MTNYMKELNLENKISTQPNNCNKVKTEDVIE